MVFRSLKCNSLTQVLVIAVVIILTVAQTEAKDWKYHLGDKKGEPYYVWGDIFTKKVESKIADNVKFKTYQLGELSTSTTSLAEMLQMNVVNFANLGIAPMGKFLPEMQVYYLHYLFPSDEDLYDKALTHPTNLKKAVQDKLHKKNMHLLTVFPAGWMGWVGKGEGIRSLDDLKGIKFRVMTSPLLVKQYTLYGANPIAMPYMELYSGMQLGAVDGFEMPLKYMVSQNFFEVSDAFTEGKHLQFAVAFLVNYKFWKSIPDDFKNIIHEAIEETHPEYLKNYLHLQHEKSKAEILKLKPDFKFIKLSDKEILPFKEKVKLAREEYIKLVGSREEAEAVIKAIEMDIEDAKKLK